MRPIFKTEISIYQSKANLEKKIFFGKITHHLEQEIKKMLIRIWVRGMFENKDSTCKSGP